MRNLNAQLHSSGDVHHDPIVIDTASTHFVRVFLTERLYVDLELFERDGIAGVAIRTDGQIVITPRSSNVVNVEVRR